jgi:phosphohistidine phosphatase SixA
MGMRLYLIRHADAQEPQPDVHDGLRPLTATGNRQAVALADALARRIPPLTIPPARLVSSPAVRAMQTAEPGALALGLGAEVDPRLAPGQDAAAAERVISDLLACGVGAAALVGHNPMLEGLVYALGDRAGPVHKAQVVAFDVTRGPEGWSAAPAGRWRPEA